LRNSKVKGDQGDKIEGRVECGYIGVAIMELPPPSPLDGRVE